MSGNATPTITLPEKVRALLTSFKGIFQGALAQTPSNAMKFATKVTSTSVSNTYAWLGQSSSFREWVGARVAQSVAKFAYMIVNKDYEMTQVVPKTAIEDDQVGIYTPLVADMGESAMRDVDEKIFGALKNGTTGVCFDGLPYFHEAHPVQFDEEGNAVAGSPTYSNLLKVTGDNAVQGPAWIVCCTARQIKPVIYQERKAPVFVSKTALTDENVFHNNEFIFGADKRDAVGYTLPQLAVMSTQPLTPANFAKAVALIEGATGDKGKKLGLTVTDLITGTDLRVDAMDILKAEKTTGGKSNIWKDYCALTVTGYMD
jgi:phage major head subunit gpT-like protein